MKKSISFIAAAFAIVAAASCSKEIEGVNASEGTGLVPVELSAGIESTKAEVSAEGKVLWQAGDKIAVWVSGTTYEMELISGEGTNSGRFRGELPEDGTITAAVYPSVSAGAAAGQVLPKLAQTIASGATCDPEAVIMTAGAASGESLSFSNACGGARFTVAEGVTGITFYNSEADVTVTLPGTAGDYDVMLPVGEYSNALVAEVSAAGTKGAAIARLNVKRSTIIRMGGLTPEDCSVITNADELQAFFTEPSTDGYIVKDIDLTDVEITPCASLSTKLDGLGHSLKNCVISAPLVTANAGTLKGIVIDASCSCTFSAATTAVLCGTNSGTVESCINNADITLSAVSAAGFHGGLIARSTGVVKACVNNGDITADLDAITGRQYYGGVVAEVSVQKTAGTTVFVSDCENNGDIAIYSAAKPGNCYFGGVVGGNTATGSADVANIGIISNCTNNGDISYGFTTLGSGTYTNLGGVVGNWEGSLDKCSNTGSVSFKLPYEEAPSTNATCPAVGGVGGLCFYDVTDCTNEGDITIEGVWAAGTAGNAGAGWYVGPSFGGVIGKNGTAKDAVDNSIVISGCTNKGAINTITYMKSGGGTADYLGGVVGETNGKILDCSNEGEINAKFGAKNDNLGGIVGYFIGSTVSGCTNKAPITVCGTALVGASVSAAGVIGLAQSKATVIDDCHNTGTLTLNDITSTSTSYQYLAGICANYDSNSQVVSNCTNSGKIVANCSRKLRIAGLVAALYDATQTSATASGGEITSTGTPGQHPISNCANYGDIEIVNAGNPAGAMPGSLVGGIVAYSSVGLDNCISSGDITVKASTDPNLGCGLLYGTANRRYDVTDCEVDASITCAAETANIGLLCGMPYDANLGTVYFNLGTEGHPLTIKAGSALNGVPVSSPATLDELVGGAAGEFAFKSQQFYLTNVQVQ